MDRASNTCRSTSSRKSEKGYLDDSRGIPARLTVANHDDLCEATAVGGGGHDRGRTRRASEFAPRDGGASGVVHDAVRPLDAKRNYNSSFACDLGETRVDRSPRNGGGGPDGRLEMVSITNLEAKLLADANYPVADLTRRSGLATCFRRPSLNELIDI